MKYLSIYKNYASQINIVRITPLKFLAKIYNKSLLGSYLASDDRLSMYVLRFPTNCQCALRLRNKENKQQLRKIYKLLLMQLQMKRCVRIFTLRSTAFRETKYQFIKTENERKPFH